jgi:hypothetical protein
MGAGAQRFFSGGGEKIIPLGADVTDFDIIAIGKLTCN